MLQESIPSVILFTLHISLITLEVAVNVINDSVMSTFANDSKRGQRYTIYIYILLGDTEESTCRMIWINENDCR